MKLSTKGRYALEGLLYMAVAKNQVVSVKELGEQTGTSPAYMEQIFYKLKQAGLVQTVRGAKGGFEFAKLPEQITVGNIIRAIEGTLVPVKCVENLAECKSKVRSKCTSRGVWVLVSKAIEETADGITIAALRDGFLKGQDGGENA